MGPGTPLDSREMTSSGGTRRTCLYTCLWETPCAPEVAQLRQLQAGFPPARCCPHRCPGLSVLQPRVSCVSSPCGFSHAAPHGASLGREPGAAGRAADHQAPSGRCVPPSTACAPVWGCDRKPGVAHASGQRPQIKPTAALSDSFTWASRFRAGARWAGAVHVRTGGRTSQRRPVLPASPTPSRQPGMHGPFPRVRAAGQCAECGGRGRTFIWVPGEVKTSHIRKLARAGLKGRVWLWLISPVILWPERRFWYEPWCGQRGTRRPPVLTHPTTTPDVRLAPGRGRQVASAVCWTVALLTQGHRGSLESPASAEL